MKKKLNILHFAMLRQLTPGQLKQLDHEARAASYLNHVAWTTLAYHTGNEVKPYAKQLPFLFRPVFLRHLFAWIYMLRHHRKYDYIICRHIAFDPFSFFFARYIPNRIPVHHGIETQGLLSSRPGILGRLAASLEKYSVRSSLRYAVGIMGVTDEICSYHLENNAPNKNMPIIMYPNGIYLENVQTIDDKRSGIAYNIVFICGKFSKWHGLDLLLSDMLNDTEVLTYPGTLHLIGELTPDNQVLVTAINDQKKLFKVKHHGRLPYEAYSRILATCDVGLSSFALHRQGITKATTLKVREMLALGLPVYSGHADSAIPREFTYYRIGDPSLREIIMFSNEMRKITREKVRNESTEYIDKLQILKKTIQIIAGISNS